ncbi:MAG: hypothetical protein LBE99_00075 [Puniceicoccales bacterium]|jgi:hypothetical protein|nr:hypothetical protein [Puniceicoccales bacterium]
MKQIMSKFLKTSLVAAGLMGVVTLNAGWCNHCNRDHRGRVCPATGHTQDTQYFGCGDPYGCWRMDVDSDDEDAYLEDQMRDRAARHRKQHDDVVGYARRANPRELDALVGDMGDVLEARGFHIARDDGGRYGVVPAGRQLAQGFHPIVHGQGVPPPHFDRPFLFGCEDEFDGFGCHADFAPPPYGCYHRFRGYGCRY